MAPTTMATFPHDLQEPDPLASELDINTIYSVITIITVVDIIYLHEGLVLFPG